MDGTTVAHQSTVCDSILGSGVTFGANTTVANRPQQGDTVTMTLGEETVDTGRDTFGVVVGDQTRTGTNTTLDAGVAIGPNKTTRPGETLLTDSR